jgi:hypothetical protein
MDRLKMISMVVVLLFLSSVISSCSKGGSGSGSGGGVTVDNSKAIGTFTATTLAGTSGYSVDIDTVTFDGAGHGTYSSLSSSVSGTFNYTVTVPGNDLTIDDTFIGTINAAGNFFTAVDVSSFASGTNIQMLTGVKKGSGITDNAAITYVGGSFAAGMNPSSLDRLSIAMHTPLASVLTFTSLTSGGTGTIDYVLASDGTFTVDPSGKPLLGAVSDDKSIMIFTDNVGVACALKLPGSGMTNALLNGTYKAYRFVDNNVSGPSAFSAGRTTWTFDGFGVGKYQRTADSGGVLGQGTMTYTVSPDGTFVLGSLAGISLADGSVIAFFDDETFNLNNIISIVIAIKQ